MPPANQDVGAVTRSQEFFRLKQIVQSPGDIYELDESAKAIYIGPDSDVSEVLVTYFNPDEPLGLEQAVVSVNGPLVGRIDSLPAKTVVPSTSQPARILVSPVDIVNNEYADPDTAATRQYNIPAVIDLFVALKALPDIPQTRADRTIRLPRVPYGPGANSTDIVVPIYGRKMITVNFTGQHGQIVFKLVTLTHGGKNRGRALGAAVALQSSPFDLAQGVVIRASNDLGPNAATISGSYVNYTVPGPVQSGLVDESPLNQVRGQADLLVMQIVRPGGPGNVLNFMDIVIRLSDRET